MSQHLGSEQFEKNRQAQEKQEEERKKLDQRIQEILAKEKEDQGNVINLKIIFLNFFL